MKEVEWRAGYRVDPEFSIGTRTAFDDDDAYLPSPIVLRDADADAEGDATEDTTEDASQDAGDE